MLCHKIFLPFIAILLYSCSLYGQNEVPAPALWLKTQSNASGMASLTDKGSIIQEWESSAYSTVNFHPIPIIGAHVADLSAQPIEANGGITVFSVYQSSLLNREQVVWSVADGNNLVAYATDSRFSSVANSVDYTFAGITNQWLRLSTHFLNHQSLKSPSCVHYLGQHPRKPEITFRGLLLEEVVFDKSLSKRQRKQVESYLSAKYGIPLLSSGKLEYINSLGSTYWSAATNDPFRHRPTVIGRDDFWQLTQRQATSAYEPDLITIGIGEIAPFNSENPNEPENLSFLVWADNNKKLAINKGSGLLERTWEISTIDTLIPSTSLRLGVRQLKTELGPNEKYWLAIDRSSGGSFAVQSTDYYPPTLRSNRSYQEYEQVQWDTDRSGRDHFTFIKGEDILLIVDSDLPECVSEQLGSIRFKAYGGKAPYAYQIDALNVAVEDWPGTLETLDNIPAGQYTLSVTDAEGAQIRQVIDMHRSDLVESTGMQSAYTISRGEPLELTLPIDCEECVYEWVYPDGSVRHNRTLSTAIPGNYKLTIDKSGCKDTYEFSIQERPSPFQSVELWGNPARDGVYTLEIRLWEAQPVQFTVFNQSGQGAQTIRLPLNHYHKYTGSGLPQGTHYIRVDCNGQSITKKLISH